MAKASEVIGRPVVSRGGGEELGKVKDLVVDPSIELGKDVGFVDPGVEATIQRSGGMKGAFKRSE